MKKLIALFFPLAVNAHAAPIIPPCPNHQYSFQIYDVKKFDDGTTKVKIIESITCPDGRVTIYMEGKQPILRVQAFDNDVNSNQNRNPW